MNMEMFVEAGRTQGEDSGAVIVNADPREISQRMCVFACARCACCPPVARCPLPGKHHHSAVRLAVQGAFLRQSAWQSAGHRLWCSGAADGRTIMCVCVAQGVLQAEPDPNRC